MLNWRSSEPVQCRKRWSNLARDFRKIKEWDSQIKEEADSFCIMRNNLRREKKLHGFFDKEIYDVLEKVNITLTGTKLVPVKEEGGTGVSVEEEEEEAVFDSGGAAAAEDGLFSDFEQLKQEDDDMEDTPPTDSTPKTTTIAAPIPISERRYQPFDKAFFDQGNVECWSYDKDLHGSLQAYSRTNVKEKARDVLGIHINSAVILLAFAFIS